MKAIQTKYIAPTVHKPARVKAFAEGGSSLTILWDDSFDTNVNHLIVAERLAKSLNWPGKYTGGTLENGDMVWVIENETDSFEIK